MNKSNDYHLGVCLPPVVWEGVAQLLKGGEFNASVARLGGE